MTIWRARWSETVTTNLRTLGAVFVLLLLPLTSPIAQSTARTTSQTGAQAGPQSAQNPSLGAPRAPLQNALRVYVVNGRDKPVALAEVTVTHADQHAAGRTDSAGIFRVAHLAEGDWQATVRRIGYSQAVVDVHVAPGDNAYTITVDPVSTTLTDVNVVEARHVSIRIADFEERRARGQPSAVITREQLQKRDPITLSQMFRTLPGVRVLDDHGVKVVVASRGMVPAIGRVVELCPMRIAVDGMLRPPLTNLDETVPSDVYGIEVYYGPASLPLQLATFRADKWCGLVAIWTRDQ